MKLLLTLACLTFTTLTIASPLIPMTVKERLRIHLWTEGLKDPQLSNNSLSKPRLPEEIEKPLKKF